MLPVPKSTCAPPLPHESATKLVGLVTSATPDLWVHCQWALSTPTPMSVDPPNTRAPQCAAVCASWLCNLGVRHCRLQLCDSSLLAVSTDTSHQPLNACFCWARLESEATSCKCYLFKGKTIAGVAAEANIDVEKARPPVATVICNGKKTIAGVAAEAQ